MPLKLTVGLARKVGQPNYGSLEASCGIEVELETSLLAGDAEAFRARVRDAFVVCSRAIDDELALRQSSPNEPNRNGQAMNSALNGAWRENGRACRPATRRQIQTIVALARRHRANLESVLRGEFDVASPEELSLEQASRLIDGLRTAAGSGFITTPTDLE